MATGQGTTAFAAAVGVPSRRSGNIQCADRGFSARGFRFGVGLLSVSRGLGPINTAGEFAVAAPLSIILRAPLPSAPSRLVRLRKKGC